MQRSLTPPERETVVLMNDDDSTATITTWQRPIITKLKRNPAATLIEEMQLGTSAGARFEMPAALISFRSKRGKGGKGNPDALRRARSAVR